MNMNVTWLPRIHRQPPPPPTPLRDFFMDGWLLVMGLGLWISTLAYDLLLKNAVIIIPVTIGISKICFLPQDIDISAQL